MNPGSDLTAVSLPILPEGHRWAIMSVRDSLVDLVEYVAQDIYDQQVKQLQRLLEEESIIGIYQDEALPN